MIVSWRAVELTHFIDSHAKGEPMTLPHGESSRSMWTLDEREFERYNEGR
jgi:hypothetical protein